MGTMVLDSWISAGNLYFYLALKSAAADSEQFCCLCFIAARVGECFSYQLPLGCCKVESPFSGIFVVGMRKDGR